MPRCLGGLCRALTIVLAVLLASRENHAGVVVFDAQVKARAVEEPLRIQLGSQIVQSGGSSLANVPTEARARYVERALRESSTAPDQPLLGVWLEPSPTTPGAYTAFLVILKTRAHTARHEQLALQPDAQSERALALTITELYRTLEQVEPESTPSASVGAQLTPGTFAPREPRGRNVQALLAAGQLVRAPAGGLSPLLSIELMGGAQWALPHVLLTAYLGGYWQLPRNRAIAGGYLEYSEQSALFGGAVRAPLGAVEPGVVVEARWTQLGAAAKVGDRSGERKLQHWSAALHAVTGYAVSRNFKVELSAGAALQLQPTSFTVFGSKLAEIPRFVPEARLLLVYLL